MYYHVPAAGLLPNCRFIHTYKCTIMTLGWQVQFFKEILHFIKCWKFKIEEVGNWPKRTPREGSETRSMNSSTTSEFRNCAKKHLSAMSCGSHKAWWIIKQIEIARCDGLWAKRDGINMITMTSRKSDYLISSAGRKAIVLVTFERCALDKDWGLSGTQKQLQSFLFEVMSCVSFVVTICRGNDSHFLGASRPFISRSVGGEHFY